MMEDSRARFERELIASPALQERLGAIGMPEAFEEAAIAAAAELGIVLPPGALSDRGGNDSIGTSRFQPAPVELGRWPEIGWLPARSAAGSRRLAFDWAWFGSRGLTEPFYEDSVRRMATRPLSQAFRMRTALDALVAGAAQEDTLAPQGFVFHMSRCGSTLAAQMLAAVPHHLVVSEAEPIDAVVQWARASEVAMDARIAALRAVVAALGRRRSDSVRRYFVKLDCWHALALPLFRAAFPDVPWIFLYRDPAEVMVSQARMPGAHLGMPGLVPEEAAAVFSIESHGARVLAALLSAAAEHQALGGGMLVNYAGLVPAMAAAIPAHFGFAPDADERAAMVAAAARDAKAPDAHFVADSASKRAAVTPAIAAAVGRYLHSPYERLEALRIRQPYH